MSVKIIKERGAKEEIPLAGIGKDGEIILPHASPNRHYIWYTQTNFIYLSSTPYKQALKAAYAKPIYKGGEINITLEQRN